VKAKQEVAEQTGSSGAGRPGRHDLSAARERRETRGVRVAQTYSEPAALSGLGAAVLKNVFLHEPALGSDAAQPRVWPAHDPDHPGKAVC
jgi:hypothetical protein